VFRMCGVPPQPSFGTTLSMAVRRPSWWCYPERCATGHEWGPGLIIVSWSPCDCPPAVAERGVYSGAGTWRCTAPPRRPAGRSGTGRAASRGERWGLTIFVR
jgi:hypothetical protein